jgi:hypothetical protein
MPDPDLADRIVGLLTPLVGQNMARASVIAHCTKNGLDPHHLGAVDLPVLARGIGTALVCFVGRSRADMVAAAILSLAGR